MKDRIRQIMEANHMTQQTFANFIGINAASLSSIFNNRTKPTINTVEAIKSKIPNLNLEWLMFGSGSMYVSDDNASDNTPTIDNHHSEEMSFDFGGGRQDLFDSAAEPSSTHTPRSVSAVNIRPEVKYIERPQRQITEIRVYFDDQTYESFVPKK